MIPSQILGELKKKAMNASVVLALAEIRRHSPILEVLEKKATARSPAPCTTSPIAWSSSPPSLAAQRMGAPIKYLGIVGQ
jgi:hypothetical protein